MPYAEVQTHQTLGRCYLAQEKFDLAQKSFEAQLALATRVEDKRNQTLSQIYLARVQIGKKSYSGAGFIEPGVRRNQYFVKRFDDWFISDCEWNPEPRVIKL